MCTKNPPEFIAGAKAREDGQPKSSCPYAYDAVNDPYDVQHTFRVMWESGWEWQKEQEGSRYWCDKCRKPLYDATYCGNCGQPAST